ncbi:hypothetical protein [Spiroplasma eriocheiris]|uniref:Uncharacterized protein n=1 Tax=Spiroplasma eriocheiris TaxID=315358 RepID=A0A0H3XMQ4_9MOLU|nr:hypothetical protein [Spiroplasma eriocheiris]AHF57852.1 hypothetical protein SPE_0730 [Spiroplasma eriocheiris CCTCC M 207170]AKM54297.1 hypothetical protein SERIO_v1c07340 [Spiroplasma eriocheiris]
MKNLLTILGTSVIGVSSALGATMHAKTNLDEISVKTTNQLKADDTIKVDLNFYKEDSFNGTSSQAAYGETHIIFNFLDYANSWEAFIDKYPTVTVSGYIHVYAWTGSEVNKIRAFTSDISSDVSSTEAVWIAYSSEAEGYSHQELNFTLALWHDDHNIYWGYSVME